LIGHADQFLVRTGRPLRPRKPTSLVCKVGFSWGRGRWESRADVAGNAVPLHGVEDVPGAVHERHSGGFAVDGVGQLADDHADAVAPFGREFVRAAGVGGHGVPVGQQLVDGGDPMVPLAPKTVTLMRVGASAGG
jgi:hypothetical protein